MCLFRKQYSKADELVWITTVFSSLTPQPQIWDATLNLGTHRAREQMCVWTEAHTVSAVTHTDACSEVYTNKTREKHRHTVMWLLAHPGWHVCGTGGCQWTWGCPLKPLQKILSWPALNVHVTVSVLHLHSHTHKDTQITRYEGVLVYSTDAPQARDADSTAVPQGWLSLFVLL